MIITWNGVYNEIGKLFIGEKSYGIYSNHVERCSLIFNRQEGVVFQADWKDPRWKTITQNRKQKDLIEVLRKYATT